MFLKKVAKGFKTLNSNTHPGEIAHAVCMALILGFLPKTNLLWYILTTFFLFMRINRPTLVIFTLVFSLLSPLADPLFDIVGFWFLNIKFLYPAFAWLLDIPFVGFTYFNNSIVAGSLLISLILYAPMYFLAKFIVKIWRDKFTPFIRKTKLVAFLSKIPFIVKIGEKL